MGSLYLPGSKTLDNVEELVSQNRLDKLYDRLIKRGHEDVAELVTFVAYVMPPNDKVATPYAYFRVISEHPKRRFPGQQLETIGSAPLSQWREMEADYWRYADAPDPLIVIFAGLLKQHMETRQNLKELND